jgi:hypothetical protein
MAAALSPPESERRKDDSFSYVHKRKMRLFAGNDGGARHRAIAMTLIQTAKLNGVEPMTYLTDVLQRIVSGRTEWPAGATVQSLA